MLLCWFGYFINVDDFKQENHIPNARKYDNPVSFNYLMIVGSKLILVNKAKTQTYFIPGHFCSYSNILWFSSPRTKWNLGS